MKFNTSTLAYKLLSGKLEERRNHSEQLNKYVAGLIDSDGCISISFKAHSNRQYGVYLNVSVDQSASNDIDFQLLRSLQSFYKLGTIYYYQRDSEIVKSHSAKWLMSTKDSLKLFNLLGKHLRVKGTHFENLVWLVTELKGVSIQDTDGLREFSKCSRQNSRWLKHPKHPSWAWLAGFLDGDGHYRCRIDRLRTYSDGSTCRANELKLYLGVHEDDKFILEFLKDAFKGSLAQRKDGLYFWQRSLGKSSEKFALPFLKQLRKYSCLEKKYTEICKMIHFHENNKEQRLNKQEAKA